MIDKNLLGLMEEERKLLFLSIFLKIISLFINVIMIFQLASFIEKTVVENTFQYITIGIYFLLIVVKLIVSKLEAFISFRLSADLKAKLRSKLFKKVYSMGLYYKNIVEPGELVQLSVEGIENLQTYFGNFIPQLAYSIISPIILYLILYRVDRYIALALLILVPAIPIAIFIVQKLAKKVNKEYWGSYTALSEIFLDFLEGLTTLRIYKSDQEANDRLNEYSEDFRVKTMDVLAVQLNNITVMDIVAYLGTALGSIMTLWRLSQGNLSLYGSIIFILIASEFFLPLRQLGSFFHIAMSGMASSDKLFKILESDPPDTSDNKLQSNQIKISLENLSFSYDGVEDVLKDINMDFSPASLTVISGKSGCGKSTIASLIMGQIIADRGKLFINGYEDISHDSRMENFTLITTSPYLFKETVRYNLQMGDPTASDQKLWEVLKLLDLKETLIKVEGLDTQLEEGASNFSGGQRQRLALAKAILKDSNVYIFDEATSNIDSQSEEKIMEVIKELSETKTIILISHHLKNAKEADHIYYLEEGRIMEEGDFDSLIESKGDFYDLYNKQNSIEKWWLDWKN